MHGSDYYHHHQSNQELIYTDVMNTGKSTLGDVDKELVYFFQGSMFSGPDIRKYKSTHAMILGSYNTIPCFKDFRKYSHKLHPKVLQMLRTTVYVCLVFYG